MVLAATLLSLTLPAQAEDSGKALYTSCAACHGAMGEGNPLMKAPSLAGMDSDYLARQLKNFKSGLRGSDAKDTLGAQMKAMSATLVNEQAIDEVSTYISGLEVASNSAPAEGDVRKGNNLYQGSCGSCHGGQGQGNPKFQAPRLANQDAQYLTRQFNNFKQGLRGTHKEDRMGRQMKMMANMLNSDQDLQDVLAYLQAIKP
jgi:cbb3-type cytochrome c oxidase subunit III